MRPQKFDIYFIYICDECKSELWLSGEKAKLPHQKLECCGKFYNVEQMTNFTVNCKFGMADIKKQAEDILRSSGYPVELLEGCVGNTPQDLVRAALSKVEI